MSELNAGDTAWVLASSCLVMIMTPAVGFFYGGLVKQGTVLTTILYSYIAFAVISIEWYLFGFSLLFGPSAHGSGFLGNFDFAFLDIFSFDPSETYGTTIPFVLFFFFQLQFAAVTPALISGAVCNRMKMGAFILLVIFWCPLVYAPIGHWVWNPEGWAFKLGVIDFAGGTVVHISAGFAALAASIICGKNKDSNPAKAANIPIVLIGDALCWFGWFGFNGGSALSAGGLAANACVVTNTAATGAALTWMGMEYAFDRKSTSVGFTMGSLVGLVAITPASGYVTIWASLLIGIIATVCVYLFVRLKNKYLKFDDTMDVFSCHGIGGACGTILTGLFATTKINSAAYDGAFYGNGALLWKQIVIVLASAAWSFVISSILLLALKKTIGITYDEAVQTAGLDKHVFGEAANTFGNVFDEEKDGFIEMVSTRIHKGQISPMPRTPDLEEMNSGVLRENSSSRLDILRDNSNRSRLSVIHL